MWLFSIHLNYQLSLWECKLPGGNGFTAKRVWFGTTPGQTMQPYCIAQMRNGMGSAKSAHVLVGCDTGCLLLIDAWEAGDKRVSDFVKERGVIRLPCLEPIITISELKGANQRGLFLCGQVSGVVTILNVNKRILVLQINVASHVPIKKMQETPQ